MTVDKNNAQQFGYLHKTLHVAKHKEKEKDDPRRFDDRAPRHPIRAVIKKIEQVAGDGHHDKGIHVPESGGEGLPGWDRGWLFKVFQSDIEN